MQVASFNFPFVFGADTSAQDARLASHEFEPYVPVDALDSHQLPVLVRSKQVRSCITYTSKPWPLNNFLPCRSLQ